MWLLQHTTLSGLLTLCTVNKTHAEANACTNTHRDYVSAWPVDRGKCYSGSDGEQQGSIEGVFSK